MVCVCGIYSLFTVRTEKCERVQKLTAVVWFPFWILLQVGGISHVRLGFTVLVSRIIPVTVLVFFHGIC